MAAENSNLPKLGVIVFDIEKTGKWLVEDDPVFAIGIATASIEETKIDGVKSFSAALDLRKPQDLSWAQFWDNQGYEEDCWNFFWSNHPNILDKLQDPNQIHLVSTRRQLVSWVNAVLKTCEEMYQDTIIVTDTITFDTVFLGSELLKFGFQPLNHTREGKYRTGGGVEVDSFISGIFGQLSWSELKEKTDEHLTPIFGNVVEHDHHPENDAKSILLKYLSAVIYRKTISIQ
jgi:hypothetical protein